MAKITRLSLYVINRVKIRRYVLGYSAERLSTLVKRAHGYVLTAEDPTLKSQYPINELPILAQELKFGIHDLLPSDDMDQTSSGELVDKVIISLDNELDTLVILKALIEYGYFKQSKTLDETALYLYIDKQNELEILELVFKKAVDNGLLKQDDNLFLS